MGIRMAAHEDLKLKYEQLAPKLDKLKHEVIYILEQKIKSSGIPIHMISGRIKTLDSLNAKAKRLDIQSPLDDIGDICGVRIICLFLSDVSRLGEIIDRFFHVLRIDDKAASKAEDQFGYLSVHCICRLPDSCTGPRYDDIKELRFEVQLRTIAMHSWATISHYLDYKSAQAIPSELRKDFHALSGLFYVADSHFELFFRSNEKFRKRVEQRIKKVTDFSGEEINGSTLEAFLHRKYPKRKHADSPSISELVGELVAAGYTSLGQLDSDLDKAAEAFKYYETHFPPPLKSKRYADVGIVRGALSIVNDEFLKIRKNKVKLPDSHYERYIEPRKKIK